MLQKAYLSALFYVENKENLYFVKHSDNYSSEFTKKSEIHKGPRRTAEKTPSSQNLMLQSFKEKNYYGNYIFFGYYYFRMKSSKFGMNFPKKLSNKSFFDGQIVPTK